MGGKLTKQRVEVREVIAPNRQLERAEADAERGGAGAGCRGNRCACTQCCYTEVQTECAFSREGSANHGWPLSGPANAQWGRGGQNRRREMGAELERSRFSGLEFAVRGDFQGLDTVCAIIANKWLSSAMCKLAF